MLILHCSNHLENLSQQFAELVSNPLQHPFAAEQVVVQNPAMGRWLCLQMATKLGICANYQFFSPANYMWSLLRKVVDDIPEDDPSQPATLRWRLFALFLHQRQDYPELKHYLNNEASAWDLANALAPVLDQYLFYRPEWILKWEAGEFAKEDWQARLWQRIMMDEAGETRQMHHWLDLQEKFMLSFSSKHQQQYAGKFPQRVSFFAISALSPGYLKLLAELSTKIEVHLFIVNPCRLPWYETGSTAAHNALLNSFAQQGQAFLQQLHQLGVDPQYQWVEAQADSILQCLQSHVLQQTEQQTTLSERQSIQFHACHTPMREIEVLHDQILAVLEQSKNLNPADIIVMAPAIEQYIPYIEAVFLTAEQKLPFNIANANNDQYQAEVEIFLKLLALPEQRFSVEAVFELLEYPQICERFKLDQKQVLQCREWAQATNIRWGVSAKMRADIDLPATFEHSWKYGLDRMLLGYMMPGKRLFDQELLPFNAIEGNDAQLLAAFKSFTDTIFQLASIALIKQEVSAWGEDLRALLLSIFAENKPPSRLLQVIDTLQQQAKLAEFSSEISFNRIKSNITELLQPSTEDHFMNRGITFCELLPMRSVPFKMIALLGMNDGDFPRQDSRHSFDKMAEDIKIGDRSRQSEDRYLFLESLLAARERFYISYIGQSVQDNGSLPPSVIISELLDYLSKITGQAQEEWICKHPLQAFSARYYTGENKALFSYVKEYIDLHQQPEKPQQNTPFFNGEPLPVDDKFKHITLEQLIQFYKSPARSFLKQGFLIQLFNDDDELPIREPFALESFIDKKIREQIEPNEAIDSNQYDLKLCRAKGLLPHGDVGETLFNQQDEIVKDFYQRYPQLLDLKTKQQAFYLELGEFTLSGKLSHLNETNCIQQHLGTYYAGDLLAIWLHHLVMNTVPLENVASAETQVYQPSEAFVLTEINDAKNILQQLVEGYWKGLQQPLHFFAKPAYKMYEKSPKANISAAHLAWNNAFFASEADKFENKLLFADEDVFNQEFENFAEITFGRMAEVKEKL